MTEQELLEKAFNERDIVTLRRFKDHKDVDFSFKNNLMLHTIISEQLHMNYFSIILWRKECNIFSNLHELFILAAKHNNNKMINTLKKSIEDNTLITLKFDFFLELCKTMNQRAIEIIITHYKLALFEDRISNQQFFNFLKNGIIYIIENLDFTTYKLTHFILLNYSFENFIIIRTILKLPTSKKKNDLLIAISGSKQDYLNSDLILDKVFIEKYSNCKEEFDALREFLFHSLRYFCTISPKTIMTNKSIFKKESNNITKEQYNYKILLPKIFQMTEDFDPFYSFPTNIFLENVLYGNANVDNNDVIMELIKHYDFPSRALIAIIFHSSNYTLFETVFDYFKFTNAHFDFSLMQVFIQKNHTEFNRLNYDLKMIIDKVMQTENAKYYLSTIDCVINLLTYPFQMSLYILSQMDYLFTQFSDKNDATKIYKTIIDIREPIILNYFIENKVLFNYVDLISLKNTTNIKNQQKYIILEQAIKIFNF